MKETTMPNQTQEINSSWMTNLGTSADDVRITQFPLPGSHDAVSYGTINEKSKTQGKSILEQLKAGIRYFDLRVRVDNGIFFGHHGADEVRDNQYCPSSPKPKGVTSTVFEDIQKFSQAHPKEIIILHFYDATSVWGQSFNEEDKKNFIAQVSATFRLALPPAGEHPPTYGELKRNRTSVIAMINDGNSDSGWSLEGSFDAAFCKNHNIWLSSSWFGERFSDYKRLAGRSYQYLYELTAEDQEEYLISERDLNKFWVSQTILGYDNASTSDGHSANYWGAKAMNTMWLPTFKNWFQGKQWNGDHTKVVPKPNVLLVDYAGVFGDFTDEFSSLLKNYDLEAANFTGSGRKEIAVFHDKGDNTTSLSLFSPTGSNSFQPKLVWDSGPGNWRAMSMFKILTGNFSGTGRDQIAVFYDYGHNETGLWIFSAFSDGTFKPEKIWDSGFGNWNANAMSQVVVGDFLGKGKDDIAIFYDYGNRQTALWIFSINNNGSFEAIKVWDSGFGNWDATAMASVLVGDFSGSGKQDIAVFYDYGYNETKLWTFSASGNTPFEPKVVWQSGYGNWGVSAMARVVVSDFSGSGKDEIAIFNDYGNNETKLWIFSATGSSSFEPRIVWQSGRGNWNANAMARIVVGDFSGSDKNIIAVFYDYGNNETKIWTFSTADDRTFEPKIAWESNSGNWDAKAMSKIIEGDFTGCGKTEIAALYNYDLSTTGLWMFSTINNNSFQPKMLWKGQLDLRKNSVLKNSLV